ncbi:MAG TPA: glutamate 5-kinase [Alphaproteobacteria bacterium]|nr:glutamate 5-kinase [Alphaproteobacteria bacterium]
MTEAKSPRLEDAKRLVVKIGSALLVDEDTGKLRRAWLDSLADDVARMRARGQEVLIVSSGAIALGRHQLAITGRKRKLTLEEKQAAASVGQIGLAHAYQESFARHGRAISQILVTLRDTEEWRRHLNARNTLGTLLRLGAIPVINENDTVATEEIRFGDNDRLAARVAQMISADTLILLSDIDGLYEADPRRKPDAAHIALVEKITDAVEAMAGSARLGYSSGGMVTKLAAARIATGAGARMAIALGRQAHPLAALEDGARCTWFLPSTSPLTARRQLIATALKPTGSVTVDAGAVRALEANKSLLPAGIVGVEGAFERGDAILVRDGAGREVARGLSAYSAADARRIMGHRSAEIEALLGYRGREELIHRDDLVLR